MPGKKKILYLSVHQMLEYDDLRILTRAGYQVFSLGAFADPEAPRVHLRRYEPEFNSPEDLAAARECGCLPKKDGKRGKLSAEFVDRFDLIIVNHDPSIILDNIDVIFSRPIIYRTLGQLTFAFENLLKPFAERLTVVRYSEREQHSDLLKTDAIIRFGKYVDEFPKWQGGDTLLTFMHYVDWRPLRTPSLIDYQHIIAGERADLYGKSNKGIPNARGIASQEEQVTLYQKCRAYVYIHSDDTPYTLNFMEAMLTGAPILAPSASFFAKNLGPGSWRERYEIEEMLSGGAGLIYSSIDEARNILLHLDRYDRAEISRKCRARARELFDAKAIERQWHQLIESIC